MCERSTLRHHELAFLDTYKLATKVTSKPNREAFLLVMAEEYRRSSTTDVVQDGAFQNMKAI